MSLRRKLLISSLAILGAGALLIGGLRWSQSYARAHWSNFLVGDPHLGSELFQQKGCAQCHAINGVGGKIGPDLGNEQPVPSGLDEIVTAMWNHAPTMWERMRREKISYPELSYQEMAHLFAYLYTVRYLDEPGDADRGRGLFESKNCIRCHAIHGKGGTIGPELSTVGADTPIAWAQEMWNHAPAMEAELAKLNLSWPEFQGGEMNDLLAYVREECSGPRREFEFLPADPDQGARLFQSKECIVCHAVKGEGGHIGPELGPQRGQPLTLVDFAGAMWNHSPKMWREMQARKVARPTFTGREMADLIAFLFSARYFEPGGSPQIGEMLFTRRGCSNCHGPRAEGTPSAPALRGQGKNFTSVTLAAALWSHGPAMEERARERGLPWPKLQVSDVGDLLVFLNSPLSGRLHADARQPAAKH